MKKAMLLGAIFLLALTLCACSDDGAGNNAETPAPSASSGDIDEPVGDGLRTAELIMDASDGRTSDNPEEFLTYKTYHAYWDITPEELIEHLDTWTGLDFSVSVSWDKNDLIVDWKLDSSLFTGAQTEARLDDGGELVFYDAYALRWFMMDSLWRTLQWSFSCDIVYTMDGGKELAFDELSPVKVFPSDTPYMGSAFYAAHADGRGDDGKSYYLDRENMIELYFPNVFDPNGVAGDGGAMVFKSRQDNTRLEYWVLPQAEENPAERYGAKEYYDYGNGVTIALCDTLDQLSGERIYGAYIWIFDPEAFFEFESAGWYANVGIICETPDIAEGWYYELMEGAVEILSANGLDLS